MLFALLKNEGFSLESDLFSLLLDSVVSFLSIFDVLADFVKNEDLPLITGLVSGFGVGFTFTVRFTQFLPVILPNL